MANWGSIARTILNDTLRVVVIHPKKRWKTTLLKYCLRKLWTLQCRKIILQNPFYQVLSGLWTSLDKTFVHFPESLWSDHSYYPSWLRIPRLWKEPRQWSRLAHWDDKNEWSRSSLYWHGRMEFACSAQIQLPLWDIAKRRRQHHLPQIQASGINNSPLRKLYLSYYFANTRWSLPSWGLVTRVTWLAQQSAAQMDKLLNRNF